MASKAYAISWYFKILLLTAGTQAVIFAWCYFFYEDFKFGLNLIQVIIPIQIGMTIGVFTGIWSSGKLNKSKEKKSVTSLFIATMVINIAESLAIYHTEINYKKQWVYVVVIIIYIINLNTTFSCKKIENGNNNDKLILR